MLLTGLKERRLSLSGPVGRHIILMPHFSSISSLGFIPLMFSLSCPVWLLLYDIDNLCKCLISRHVFQAASRTWEASACFCQLIWEAGAGNYAAQSRSGTAAIHSCKRIAHFSSILNPGFLPDRILLLCEVFIKREPWREEWQPES